MAKNKFIPIYVEIAEKLKKKIKKGFYPPTSKLPTVVNLAGELSVNNLTIIRALDVLKKEGLIVGRRGSGNYITDSMHRPVLADRHLKIGILWPSLISQDNLINDFFGEITRGVLEYFGIEDVKASWDFTETNKNIKATWVSMPHNLQMDCISEKTSGGKNDKHPNLPEIKKGDYDGFICVGIIRQNWLDKLIGLKLPVVLVDYPNFDFELSADMVFVNPLSAYRNAIKYIKDKGIKRIHYVGGTIGKPVPGNLSEKERIAFTQNNQIPEPDNALRLNAYRQAMVEFELPSEESWVHQTRISLLDGEKFGEKLLKMTASNRPEAVLCFSLVQAQGINKVFSSKDIDFYAGGATSDKYSGAGLSIYVNAQSLGSAAATLLISRFQQPNRSYLTVAVPMEFIEPI